MEVLITGQDVPYRMENKVAIHQGPAASLAHAAVQLLPHLGTWLLTFFVLGWMYPWLSRTGE